MHSEKMRRVNKDKPCPICGKVDWCLVAPDGSAAICQRVEEGSLKKCGDAGWLHVLHDDRPTHRSPSFTTRISIRAEDSEDFDQLASMYQQQMTAGRLVGLSQRLSVSVASLGRLRVGWDGAAFTFPMNDAEGCTIGIRRRFENGFKCSVRGSRSGLFVPTDSTDSNRLLVCEGATDTAAALDLGFNALGRPSCRGAVDMIARAAKGRAEVVVVSDNDEVGRQGAMELADALVLPHRVRVVFPPAGVKDLRAWRLRGLAGEELQRIIDSVPFVDLRIE
jgi:hypothetical protein